MTIGNWTPLIILGLALAFAVYRRGRVLFTRQKLRSTLLTGRLILFAVLGGVVLLLNLGDPLALGGDLAGAAVGAAVGVLGIRLTQWDQLPDGVYYTSNVYVGLAVFGLFLLRLVYKLVTTVSVVEQATAGGQRPTAASLSSLNSLSSDPLTAAAYFVLIGYYISYYLLLLRRAPAPALR